MILSNNPQTYISITIYHGRYGAGISKKYVCRWVGPSALWNKNDIKILMILNIKRSNL